MDEVIFPWVEEIACVVREQTDAHRIVTISTEDVGKESHEEHLECLLAFRCHASAVSAVIHTAEGRSGRSIYISYLRHCPPGQPFNKQTQTMGTKNTTEAQIEDN